MIVGAILRVRMWQKTVVGGHLRTVEYVHKTIWQLILQRNIAN